jgi:hypothetical protein
MDPIRNTEGAGEQPLHRLNTKYKEAVVAECLVCGAHRFVEPDQFSGHEWCLTCGETTNHIEVGL